MSGQFSGVHAIIRKEYPTALYVHCVSHSLNLAISDACSVQAVRNCMGVIENAYIFFNTSIRQNVLTNKVSEMPDNERSRRDRLKQLCPTRWVQRQDSVSVMRELLNPPVLTLEEIAEWPDKETSTSTSSKLLLNTLST
ncbi:unnamed protein product [Psylliodes chrysocephalus]|uniref:Uncharacterized protein n=1 Tax=Psylliodes chrysocephalus TaxID=3402493 RepID=A0A9P0GKY6_9CUCU|nr:unnamed protein product [Psylliodes chrysocephala]